MASAKPLFKTTALRRAFQAVQAVRRFSMFRRDTSGVAAVEFGLVATPFFFLLFSLFEIGTTYLSAGSLQTAVNEAARQIRTGQVQTAGMTAQQFQTLVCSNLDTDYMPCDSALLKIDVRRYTSFAAVAAPSPLDGNGNWNNDFRYEPGAQCDIVLVRAFYQWKTLTPGLGAIMNNMTGGSELLQASAAIRNEPFVGAACGVSP